MENCELRQRMKGLSVACDADRCVFWSKLGLSGEPQCALNYFKLLDGAGSELAEWLLSLKEEQIAQLLGEGDAGA